MKYSFENLKVWQSSRLLVKSIYEITSEFPSDEKFGLVSQLRRAAVSVSSNIAEGSTRTGKLDQARFYQVSYSSLMEVLNQLILSNDLLFLSAEKLEELKIGIDNVSRMLNSLHHKALNP